MLELLLAGNGYGVLEVYFKARLKAGTVDIIREGTAAYVCRCSERVFF